MSGKKVVIFTTLILVILALLKLTSYKAYSLTSPATITNDPFDSINLSNSKNLVKDSLDDLYCVYYKLYNSYWHIFVVKSSTNGESWQPTNPVPIENTGNYNQAYASMAIDSSNRPHVVWAGYDSSSPNYLRIKYAYYDGADWSAWQNINSGSTLDQHYPSIAIDSSDNIHVVWMQKDSKDPSNWHIKYSEFNGSNWSATQSLETLTGYSQDYPQIAIDSNDNVHVVWSGKDSYNNDYAQIKHIKKSGGNWSGLENIQTIPSQAQAKPSIAIDNNNNLHVAWLGSDEGVGRGQVKYSKFNGSSWSNWVNIWPLSSYDQGFPSIAISPVQNPWIMWYGTNGTFTTNTLFSSYFNGYSWSTATAQTSSGNNLYPLIRWSRFNNNNASFLDYSWLENGSGTNKLMFDNFSLSDTLAQAPANSPQTPTIAQGLPDSTTSIIWQFSDNSNNEQGFRVYNQNNTLLATNNNSNQNFVIEKGLTPNTFYSGRFVRAYNQNGESLSSNPASGVYTKIESPTSLSFQNVTTKSITVKAEGNFSNLDKGYSGIYFSDLLEGNNSGWLKTNTWTYNNLTPANVYIFGANTRNGQNIENGTIFPYYKSTLPNAAGQGTVRSRGPTSINFKIEKNGNSLEYTSYGIIVFKHRRKSDTFENRYLKTDGSFSIDPALGTYAQWGGAKGITIKNLKPNTLYIFTVIALNAEGVQASEWSPYAITHTLAKKPAVNSNLRTGKWYPPKKLIFSNSLDWQDDMEFYRYSWSSNSTHNSWSGKEKKWSSGRLSLSPQKSGKYYFHVISYNQANEKNENNSSLRSSQTSDYKIGPFFIDADSPISFELKEPEHESYISGEYNFKWQESSDSQSGLDHYEIYIDDEKIGQSNSTNYEYNLLTAGLSAGWHEWSVKAVDKVGNHTSSQEKQFFFDKTKPTLKIIAPKNGVLVRGKLKIITKIQDDVSLAKIDLYIDNKWFSNINNNSQTFELETKTLSEGQHKIKIIAYDEVNNSTSNTILINVDNKAPNTTLLVKPSKPDGLNNSYETLPKITLNSNEAGFTYYNIDNNPQNVFTIPFFLSRGKHTLYYQSLDLAGNREVEKSKYFKVENNPFKIKVLKPKNKTIFSATVPIKVLLVGVKGKPSISLKIDKQTKKKVQKEILSYLWDTTKVKNGWHSISIYGYDSLLNKNKVIHIKIKVKNTIVNYVNNILNKFIKNISSNILKTAPLISIPLLLIILGSTYLTGQHFIDWRSPKLK